MKVIVVGLILFVLTVVPTQAATTNEAGAADEFDVAARALPIVSWNGITDAVEKYRAFLTKYPVSRVGVDQADTYAKVVYNYATMLRRLKRYDEALEALDVNTPSKGVTYMLKGMIILRADILVDKAKMVDGQEREKLLKEATDLLNRLMW